MDQSASRPFLIVATAFYAFAIIPCSLFAMTTSTIADSNPPAWLYGMIFYGALAVPVSMLLCIILAWLFYRMEWHRMATALTMLPILISIVPFVGMMIMNNR